MPGLTVLGYYLHQHRLESHEELLGLQLGKPKIETWFELDQEPRISFKNQRGRDENLFEVKVALSSEDTLHLRNIYTLLDMLKDVGGLLNLLTIN